MLSGANRGEQKGSLTTGELCTFISVSCSVRSGSNPTGNSRECSSCEPSSLAGGGMATDDRSLDTEGSISSEKKFTSSGYIKEAIQDHLSYTSLSRQQDVDNNGNDKIIQIEF